MRALIVIAACAAPALPRPAVLRARHVAVVPGTYRFHSELLEPQSYTSDDVALVLDPDGHAHATLVHTFTFDAQHDGELARDDEDLV